ncbi:ATP-binding protein [Vagococcus fluvialis]|uniref:ATP-binding protein n=1 Tax=Vagococcus fluvialis TaxID=2738 RepID=UPI001D0AEE34|nr:ATP-binding protein [Vagococcus fluvialis]MDT2747162.1 ATP-binding protein [Vagococcus fluvialis]MDT2781624.1 ATP-binding protein [Vagococcus fluvialis]UDM71491.1 Spo0B domain-containing protein [Vagococcus fluvialis]UDM74721.1 Spo0B domain-containing protein [Vagococcus fluvialis]UDM76352.1 Spo0B domain-containing protein [Vagococcus fluvialis]
MPLQTRKEQRYSLRTIIIFIVMISTFISLIASGILIRNYVVNQKIHQVEEKIKLITDMVARQPEIIQALETPANNETDIQQLASDIMKDTQVDFVVVLDKNLIRLSHPDQTALGKPFSNIPDAKLALDGKSHFSTKEGILGEGTRYFTPVKDNQGNVIGVICVGLRSITIDAELEEAHTKLLIGLFLGLSVGVLGATYGAYRIKKIIFNLEPYEIANLVYDKELVEQEITESILAINLNKQIILMNKEAQKLLKKIDSSYNLKLNDFLPEKLYEALFESVFISKQKIKDQRLSIDQLNIVVNTSPIFAKNKFRGAVVTFRDQSDLTLLIQQLSGTEQYIDSLRAQTHEFMNKMQVIMGMIELKQYDDVSRYINKLHNNFQAEVGYITDKVKSAAIAGYLLGKAGEAQEQKITFILDPNSYLPELTESADIHELLQILGNVLTNAFDAVKLEFVKEVTLSLNFDSEEEIIIITISDNGCGIDLSYANLIFNNKFSTKSTNRGYGLYMVHKTITSRAGLIEFSSTKDLGTEFYIEFPITKGEYK